MILGGLFKLRVLCVPVLTDANRTASISFIFVICVNHKLFNVCLVVLDSQTTLYSSIKCDIRLLCIYCHDCHVNMLTSLG